MATTSPPRSPAKRPPINHCDLAVPTLTRVKRVYRHLDDGTKLAIDHIEEGAYIFRGAHDYAKEEDGVWLMQRSPWTEFTQGKAVYFAREAKVARGYGCMAVFRANQDIFTLALDDDETLTWLHSIVKDDRVKTALKESFSLVENRKSIKVNDFLVANYICNHLSAEFKVDGYSSAKQGRFRNLHAEFALCSFCIEKLNYMCMDTRNCEILKDKMLGVGMKEKRENLRRRKHHDGSDDDLIHDTTREATQSKKHQKHSPKRGRVHDAPDDGSPLKVRRGLLQFGSPDSSPGGPGPVPFPSLSPVSNFDYTSPSHTGGAAASGFDFSSPPRQPVFGSPSSPPTGK